MNEKQSLAQAAQAELDRRQAAPHLSEQYSVHNPKGVKAALPPDQPLSGQQMQALATRHAETLTAIKRDVELRKWAVDQACGLSGTMIEAQAPAPVCPVDLAREIHAFLTEAAEPPK